MHLQTPLALQFILATPEIRAVLLPLLSNDDAVAALLADPEIRPLIIGEQAPCRAVLLVSSLPPPPTHTRHNMISRMLLRDCVFVG